VSIAVGPIYEFDEVFDDPQVKHLGLVTEIEQPGLPRPLRMLSFPFIASGIDTGVRRPAPRLGEHTREVLTELGVNEAEIERLAAAKAIALGGGASA
jgi:crotonobetainyl-CoA:carnitine CoA-transferase CaiB-like acyl-CoA transferase